MVSDNAGDAQLVDAVVRSLDRKVCNTLNICCLVDGPGAVGHTRWVGGQFALSKPELGLSNWEHGRLFSRRGVLTGDGVYSARTRYRGAQ